MGKDEGHKRMNQLQKNGFPLIGVIFLALGVFKLLRGDDWVVWIIIGVLFGGLGVVSRRKDRQP
ncbi:MAG TPA: hypothetical protein VGB65_14020 [Allosphingosinicella sp.]